RRHRRRRGAADDRAGGLPDPLPRGLGRGGARRPPLTAFQTVSGSGRGSAAAGSARVPRRTIGRQQATMATVATPMRTKAVRVGTALDRAPPRTKPTSVALLMMPLILAPARPRNRSGTRRATAIWRAEFSLALRTPPSSMSGTSRTTVGSG